jgi:serine protease Do
MPSTDSAIDPSALVRDAAQRIGPAVVGLGRGWHAGSGVVVAPGRILTVAHALPRDDVAVTFADGRRADARAVAIDRDGDLAMLEADTGDVAPVAAGHGAHPGIGAWVVALANPGGRGLRVTAGLVASAERRIRGPRGRRIAGAIEHTAPLPRGSSGGPLVDASGALLGLNALRAGDGLVLALPVSRERIAALGRGEAPARPRLGVAIAPPHAARRLRSAVGLPPRDGLLVRAVDEDGPAARAGIRRGDLIVAAGDAAVADPDDVDAALDAAGPRGHVELTIVRGIDEQRVSVELS